MRTIIVLVDYKPVLVIRANSWQEFIDKLCSGSFTDDEHNNLYLKDISKNWSNYKFSDLERVWFCLNSDIVSFKEVPIV